LASFFEWSTEQRGRLVVVSIITALAIALSVVQMLQYWNGILPMSDTTWTRYREVFLKLR
jgi:hypothetical protein